MSETPVELTQSAELLNSLVQQLPGVLYRCALDSDWSMRYISSGIESLVGYPRSDFIGNQVRSYASLIHPQDQELVERSVREAVAKQQAFDVEYRLIDAQGHVRWVHERGRGVFGADGSPQHLEGVILETTTTHSISAQLAAIIEHAPNVAIQSYDAEGRVLSWNPAAERLFGWRAEQALGRRLDEFLLSAEDFQAFLAGLQQVAAQGGASSPSEWSCLRADGGLAHCLATQFELPSLDGGDRIFICMDVDIGELHAAREALANSNHELERRVASRSDELKQAMAQLMEAEELAALGRLVAGVAHELNTPIGNTRTVASALADQVQSFHRRFEEGAALRRVELQQFLGDCVRASQLIERGMARAAEQIGHFKQVAVDQQSVQRRDFSLRATLADIVSALQPQFRGTPHQLLLGPVPDLRLDSYPGPLEQIIVNLVQNALLHGLEGRSEGGEVRIDTAIGPGGCLQICISDNGMGIPASMASKVFEPFFTTRLGRGGSGLGLHIAHNLTTGLLGGKLQLLPADAAQRGACFQLQLPLTAP
jgi:PAS domain S-box-containing protein